MHNCRPRSFRGQPRSSILVPIKSAYSFSYKWWIVTFVVSCIVSEIRRLKGWNSPICTYPTLFQRLTRGDLLKRLWSHLTCWRYINKIIIIIIINFRMKVISPEIRIMELPFSKEIMIVGRTTWTQSTSVTYRQTELRWLIPRNAQHGAVKMKTKIVVHEK